MSKAPFPILATDEPQKYPPMRLDERTYDRALACVHRDLCLDCRGCETACPSGVVYHELIEETRYRLRSKEPTEKPKRSTRFMNWIFSKIFVHHRRLKLALFPVRILQRIGIYGLMRKIGFFKLFPLGFQKMEQMLPPQGKLWPRRLATLTPARDRIAAKATVGFL